MLRKVQLFWPQNATTINQASTTSQKANSIFFFYRCFFKFQKGLVENIPSLTFTLHSNASLYLRLFQVREAVLNSAFKRMALRQKSLHGRLKVGGA